MAVWDALLEAFRAALTFLASVAGSYGVGIVLLTLLVRGILWPATWPSMVSSRKMQDLQPKLADLQKKYKNNPQKLNEETMKLWREHGVNPASGCFPLLLQLPILWALYETLRRFDFSHASFLWISTLSRPDPFYVLPILTALTTFLQSWVMLRNSPGMSGQAGQQQRMMMYLMPLLMGWITLNLPAGLGLYFVVSNIFSVFQAAMVPRVVKRTTERG